MAKNLDLESEIFYHCTGTFKPRVPHFNSFCCEIISFQKYEIAWFGVCLDGDLLSSPNPDPELIVTYKKLINL